MAESYNDKSWIAELESALKEESNISNGDETAFISDELRVEIWKSCLGVHVKSTYFDEIFDLPEQNVLRQDCQQFVAKLGNAEEEKLSVLSDLESLLTYHRKSVSIVYTTGNGWIELLLPLIALKLPRSETYLLFDAVVSKYIPRGVAFHHLFRLVLLYHDPALCSFLDTKRITSEQYALSWFQSLFAGPCSLPVITLVWDLYFQQSDPFFLLFLALVIIINSREKILALKDQPKEYTIEALATLPCALQESDVHDLCSLAQYYSCRTPGSFRQDLERCLFDDEDSPEATIAITQALCLPVNVSELVDNIVSPQELSSGDGFRFFLVDCRPADQYNAGHVSTAFHLDCNLMLQAGDVYRTAVQGLLTAQQQALDAGSSAGGEHLVFMGSGRLDQDQCTHMVVASFLRDSAKYVSILNGGYHALHDYFSESVDDSLADHCSSACLVCQENIKGGNSFPLAAGESAESIQSPSKDIFGKIGAVVKSKSVEVKEKLLEYIVNPSGGDVERHVKPSDKIGKRYRNMAPVFSIDDEHEPQDMGWSMAAEDDSQFEIVSLSAWRDRNDIIATFECKELKMNGETFDSELMVSKSHVYVLRYTGKRDCAKLVVRKPLSAIATITRKRLYPLLITFKYGTPEGDRVKITDMDQFLIPKANDAANVISQQISNLLKKGGHVEDSATSQ